MGIFTKTKKTPPSSEAGDEAVEEVKAKKPAAKKDPAKKAVKVIEAAPAQAKTETITAPVVTTAATNIVLIRPVVTEKAATAQSSTNKYTFIVAQWAKKAAVKAAVKAAYGVEPVSVNMINVEGHRMRFAKNTGKRSDFKKAIVTLPAGKTITIHKGV